MIPGGTFLLMIYKRHCEVFLSNKSLSHSLIYIVCLYSGVRVFVPNPHACKYSLELIAVLQKCFVYAANVQACNCVVGDAIEASGSLWPSDTLDHFSTSSCWCQPSGRAKVMCIKKFASLSFHMLRKKFNLNI